LILVNKKIKFKKDNKTWYKQKCVYCEQWNIWKRGDKPFKCQVEDCSSHKTPAGKQAFLTTTTEKELFELQDLYFTSKDERYLEKMFEIMTSYARSLILKRCRSKGFSLSPEDLEFKSEYASYEWLDKVLDREYKVEDSFGGYLNYKVTEALYKNKDEEQNDSTERVVNDAHGNKGTELGETKYADSINPLFSHQYRNDDNFDKKQDLLDDLEKTILLIVKEIKWNKSKQTSRNTILALIGLRFYITKKHRLDNFYSIYGNDIKILVDKMIMTIRRRLREYHIENS